MLTLNERCHSSQQLELGYATSTAPLHHRSFLFSRYTIRPSLGQTDGLVSLHHTAMPRACTAPRAPPGPGRGRHRRGLPPPAPLAAPQVRGAGHVRPRPRLRGQPAASRGLRPRPSKRVHLPVLPRQPRRRAPRPRRRFGLLLLASGRGLAVRLRRLHRAGLRGGAAAVPVPQAGHGRGRRRRVQHQLPRRPAEGGEHGARQRRR
jgi:hypothetical protein